MLLQVQTTVRVGAGLRQMCGSMILVEGCLDVILHAMLPHACCSSPKQMLCTKLVRKPHSPATELTLASPLGLSILIELV